MGAEYVIPQKLIWLAANAVLTNKVENLFISIEVLTL